MRIGIIGSGRIGGTVGRLWAQAGHEVFFSSRHPAQLAALVAQIGHGARAGTIREAAEFGALVLLSVPWGGVAEALAAAGPLDGKVLIDTTNQFAAGGLLQLPDGVSAAEYNARRAPGVRLVKAYNTLTAGFLAESAGRAGAKRVAMPYAGEEADAKRVVAGLIDESGFVPFDVGGWAEVRFMEPPRRAGAFYGEEWQLDTARALLAQLTGRAAS